MHKQLIGAIVVGLASGCWIVAQYAVGQPAVSPGSGSALPPVIETNSRRLPPLGGGLSDGDASEVTGAPPTALSGIPLLETPANLGEMAMPPIPPPPPPQDRPRSQAAMLPALPGMPALPAIPSGAQMPPLVRTTSDLNSPVPGAGNVNWTGPGATSPLMGPNSTGVTGGPLDPNNQPPLYQQPSVTDAAQERCYPLGPKLWGGAEYLMWFARSSQAPTLVQSIGVPSGAATSLFPQSSGINYNPMSGAKGTIGFWLTDAQTVGSESSYFWFGNNTRTQAFSGGSDSVLGHPYYNVVADSAAVNPVSTPGGTTGTTLVHTGLQVQGGDSNLLFSPGVPGGSFTVLAGFRYLDLREFLDVNDNMTSGSSTMTAWDHFATNNQFFGGQTGLRYSWMGQYLSLTLIGKIAYGALNENVTIDGTSTTTNANGTTTRTGGIYALNSNIGTYSRTTTAFIPEANANLGWRITPWATATLGYNLIYISQVVRPGKQIDTGINPDNLPFSGSNTGSTALRPGFAYRGESFWMQGINIGMTFQY